MKDLVHLDGILSYNTQQAKKVIFFVEGLAIFGPLGVLRRTCLAQSFQGHIWMLYVVISMFKSLFGAGTILESSTRVLEVLGSYKVSKTTQTFHTSEKHFTLVLLWCGRTSGRTVT